MIAGLEIPGAGEAEQRLRLQAEPRRGWAVRRHGTRIHPSILREYDIRGIVGSTLTEKDAYALGRASRRWRESEGVRSIAVGRDGRAHSPMLEAALVEGLAEGDIDAVRIGMGPSPMLYFAAHTLGVGGGIQVTGSHNPADYNGFKLLLNGRSVFGEEIQKLGRIAAAGEWTEGHGLVTDHEVVDAYVDRLVSDFTGGSFRIGWDAGNGAAGPIVEKLVQKLPGEHFTIFTEVDGSFPNHHPDPTGRSQSTRPQRTGDRAGSRLWHRL